MSAPPSGSWLHPGYLKAGAPLALLLVGVWFWPSVIAAVLTPFLISLLLAYVFNPVVRWLDEHVDRYVVLHRLGATALLYLAGAFLALTVGTAAAFIVAAETRALTANLSSYARALRAVYPFRVTLDEDVLVSGWAELGPVGAAGVCEATLVAILPDDRQAGVLRVRYREHISTPYALPPVDPPRDATPGAFIVARVSAWPGAATGDAQIIQLQLRGVPVARSWLETPAFRLADLVPPDLTRDLLGFARPERLRLLVREHAIPLLLGVDYGAAAQGAGSALRVTADLVGGITSGARYVFGLIFNLVLILIITFYFLVDFDRMVAFARSLLPAENREYCLRVANDIDRQLGGFLRGQATVCLAVGLLVAGGLWLISFWLPVKYPLLIGLWAGAWNIVPYLGGVMGLLPALLFTWAEILSSGGGGFIAATAAILAVFALAQSLESMVLSPRIMGNSVDMHPMVILLALLTGGQLFGLLGMLLAVPTACVLRVVLREIYLPRRPSNDKKRPDPPRREHNGGRSRKRRRNRPAGRERVHPAPTPEPNQQPRPHTEENKP